VPHVIVKAWPGKTEDQKQRLADAITREMVDIFGNSAESISVAIEDVPSERWKEAVYDPDIENAPAGTLYKTPGYRM